MTHLFNCIINPLAREVDEDLRLHIHSAVLKQKSLRQVAESKGKDLSRFLDVKPLRVFDTIVDIKEQVTHYLDSAFYNITTVALHDWGMYAEMRNLAHEKVSE